MENFAIVSCYFNPAKNPLRLQNYNRFKESLPRDVPHFNVELTFGETPNEIEDRYSTRLIADPKLSLMWQKEAMLNWQISAIVDQFEYIAWLDSDIIFPNKYWASEARALLESYEVIQLFDEVSHENSKGRFQYSLKDSFGRAIQTAEDGFDPTKALCGKAWAARTDWLTKGNDPLFYLSPIGGNDIFMTSCFYSLESKTFEDLTKDMQTSFKYTLFDFANEKHTEEISYLPGHILHCYHKEELNSNYNGRLTMLDSFDPSNIILKDGIMCWADGSNRDLQEYVEQYMLLRGITD